MASTLDSCFTENTMSKNPVAGAVTLCGVGLCMIGGAMLMQNGVQAHAASGGMPAAAAILSAASAQAEPTVVWYQVNSSQQTSQYSAHYIWRAWSDGTIEMKQVEYQDYNGVCHELSSDCPGWKVASTPSQGFKAAADINADEIVNGADLASVLSNWGAAPRVPFPPSDCPLNLINP
jgi:hypothetical protein